MLFLVGGEGRALEPNTRKPKTQGFLAVHLAPVPWFLVGNEETSPLYIHIYIYICMCIYIYAL